MLRIVDEGLRSTQQRYAEDPVDLRRAVAQIDVRRLQDRRASGTTKAVTVSTGSPGPLLPPTSTKAATEAR